MIYFILKWEQNDWMTLRGHHVKNKVLILELDYFSRLLDIKWVAILSLKLITTNYQSCSNVLFILQNYVPYYEGAEGNLEAANLALVALDLKLPQRRKTSEEMETDATKEVAPTGSTSNEEGTKKRRFVPIVY